MEEEILNFELRATKSGSYSNFKEDMIVAVVMIFLATAYYPEKKKFGIRTHSLR